MDGKSMNIRDSFIVDIVFNREEGQRKEKER